MVQSSKRTPQGETKSFFTPHHPRQMDFSLKKIHCKHLPTTRYAFTTLIKIFGLANRNHTRLKI
jgi:hypothetical protein